MSSELLSTILTFTPSSILYDDINITSEFNSTYATNNTIFVGTGATGSSGQGFSGIAISHDGTTIGVPGYDDNTSIGATWMFNVVNGIPVQNGSKLVGTGYTGTPQQGAISMSADGNTIVIGGSGDNSNIGAAWVFSRTSPSDPWIQYGSKLVGTGYMDTPTQGISVAISTTTIAIGGNQNTISPGGDMVGGVWVFNLVSTVWTQVAKLIGTGYTGAAGIGISVSLSADGLTLVSGGFGDNDSIGAVWVWTLSGGVWTQQGGKLVGTGYTVPTGSPVYQGISISLSADGNTLVYGGLYDNSGVGAVWVFKRNTGVWTQQGSKLVGTGNSGTALMGCSVSITPSANKLVFGGSGDNSDDGDGACWVFNNTGGSWIQYGSKITSTTPTAGDSIGSSVSIATDGTFVAGGNGKSWYIPYSNLSTLRVSSDLQVDGSIVGNVNLGGNVTISGTLTVPEIVATTVLATTYVTVSDVTMKTNIVPLDMDFAMNAIQKIKCYKYNYTGTEGQHYGVLAQELEDIGLGHLVTIDREGYKAVNYVELIPLLIGIMQRLSVPTQMAEEKH